MPYLPSHVANSFLYRAQSEGISDVDPMKIQKLVYCFHGWHLATKGAPGVGELFEAWPYGPVLSSLYHEFKPNRSKPIQGYAREIDPTTGDYRTLMVNPSDVNFSGVFDRVWEKYKNRSGISLSSLTHAPGTPWSLARARGSAYLANEEIQQHYRSLATSEATVAL